MSYVVGALLSQKKRPLSQQCFGWSWLPCFLMLRRQSAFHRNATRPGASGRLAARRCAASAANKRSVESKHAFPCSCPSLSVSDATTRTPNAATRAQRRTTIDEVAGAKRPESEWPSLCLPATETLLNVSCTPTAWIEDGLCAPVQGTSTCEQKFNRTLIAEGCGGASCDALNLSCATGNCTRSEPCTSDCLYTNWAVTSECTSSCSAIRGVLTRTRRVVAEACNGIACSPAALQREESCTGWQLTLDCSWSAWSSWSSCSCEANATTGARSRQRSIANSPNCGGKPCDASLSNESAQCACPADCLLGAWSSWSACGGASCGIGVRARTWEIAEQIGKDSSGCRPMSDTGAREFVAVWPDLTRPHFNHRAVCDGHSLSVPAFVVDFMVAVQRNARDCLRRRPSSASAQHREQSGQCDVRLAAGDGGLYNCMHVCADAACDNLG